MNPIKICISGLMIGSLVMSGAACNDQKAQPINKVEANVAVAAKIVPADLTIEFYTGGIFPGSSSASLTIQADGKGIFQLSPAGAALPAAKTFALKADDLKYIWETIVANRFFELAEKYNNQQICDGSFASLAITADKKVHAVGTANIAVKQFDNICRAINKVAPEDCRPGYNALAGDFGPGLDAFAVESPKTDQPAK